MASLPGCRIASRMAASRIPKRGIPAGWLLAGVLLLAGCSGSPPDTLGDAHRGLAPCPPSPNCVSSLAEDTEHHVAPLRHTLPRAEVQAALVAHLQSLDRVRITRREPGYLRAEFTSLLMRYVDDVEFWFREPGRIEVRSASRLGYSDLGVNRRRVESIREAMARWLHD